MFDVDSQEASPPTCSHLQHSKTCVDEITKEQSSKGAVRKTEFVGRVQDLVDRAKKWLHGILGLYGCLNHIGNPSMYFIGSLYFVRFSTGSKLVGSTLSGMLACQVHGVPALWIGCFAGWTTHG